MQSHRSQFQPVQWLEQSSEFIQQTFTKAGKSKAVVALSGGIDSAVAASLLVKALGAASVTGVCLPYGKQDMSDAQLIMDHLRLPAHSQMSVDIMPIVAATANALGMSIDTTLSSSQLRLGNLMARSRMMVIFDFAKQLDALVCGTENKSEHYLGYFTRFGDAASDFEPIARLYKTQVRQVAQALQLPEIFLSKSPSAGLWHGQTDESELGFSYAQADQVLEALVDRGIKLEAIADETGLLPELVGKVLAQIDANSFKLQVPYLPKE